MADRVVRRADGWYDTGADVFVPMLWDIYGAGSIGGRALPYQVRSMQRRIAELERRGA